MYKFEDILTRLQNGESEEDIVKDFTKAMNKASEEKSKRAEKEKTAAARRAAGEKLIAATREYVSVAHPDLVQYLDDKDTDIDSYLNMLDNGLKSIMALKNVADMFSDERIDSMFEMPKLDRPSADDVLSRWIKKLG